MHEEYSCSSKHTVAAAAIVTSVDSNLEIANLKSPLSLIRIITLLDTAIPKTLRRFDCFRSSYVFQETFVLVFIHK